MVPSHFLNNKDEHIKISMSLPYLGCFGEGGVEKAKAEAVLQVSDGINEGGIALSHQMI